MEDTQASPSLRSSCGKSFRCSPDDQLKELGYLEYPDQEFVRFCVVRRWPDASHRELDVVLPRLALVRSIYRAWLSCHDDDPRRFREEWTIFGESDLVPEHPFRRSEFLDRWKETGGQLFRSARACLHTLVRRRTAPVDGAVFSPAPATPRRRSPHPAA